MPTVPVPVKQSAPVPAHGPDIWQSLRMEMDRLFDSFTGRFGQSPFVPSRFGTAFSVPSPAVDIREDEAAFKLTAEIPGMTEKEIQLSLSGDTLTIKGEKREQHEEKGENRYLSERSYGEFQRAFLLPETVDREKIDASPIPSFQTTVNNPLNALHSAMISAKRATSGTNLCSGMVGISS